MPSEKWFHDVAFLESLLDNVAEGILIAELNGRIVFMNASARQLLEVPKHGSVTELSDIDGLNLKRVTLLGNALGFDDAPDCWQQGLVEMERWLTTPSGSRCFRLRTGLMERHGALPYRLVMLHDVTDLVRRRESSEGRLARDFITRDAHMQDVLRQLKRVAPTEAYVLIQGESGTGKNVLVRMLHRLSPRFSQPLVDVNCAAIPAELLESEFFGHVKGAFTSANCDRIGRFAAADHGTLFLDEIGELPLNLQAKLLKAVQEQRFEPVGSNKSRNVDVRIVSASNRNLKQAVDARLFRADLYYRLSVFTLHIPPLRERKADIPLLIEHFLNHLGARGYARAVLSDEALQMLIDYPWPGNVRELENAMEHAVICAIDGIIRRESLPYDIRTYYEQMAAKPRGTYEGNTESQLRNQLLSALKRCNNNKSAAAKMLGIDRTTLWRRMRKLGLNG